ncbi:MAG: hypothetical protein ACK4RK_04690 [Gemmataceae bacterium]
MFFPPFNTWEKQETGGKENERHKVDIQREDLFNDYPLQKGAVPFFFFTIRRKRALLCKIPRFFLTIELEKRYDPRKAAYGSQRRSKNGMRIGLPIK